MDQASTALKRASVLLALLLAALLGSAPAAALGTGHPVENTVLELDFGQIRDSLEKRAESGSVTPDVDGAGDDTSTAAASALTLVRDPRDEIGAALAGPNAPARLRSYQARAPPLG